MFRALLVHHQGVHCLLLNKTVAKQLFIWFSNCLIFLEIKVLL
jgi:hypothetical protein